MKEIKFRAWDKKEKVMMKWIDSIIWNSYQIESVKQTTPLTGKARLFEDVELMQYTGLKDKNGKEIYEGDIIEIWIHGDEGDKCFSEVRGYGEIEYHGDCYDVILLKWQNDIVYHVIGNKYENPKLLESSNE